MRYERRRTICISTQVGCAMGCVFCATGQMGFLRNLSPGEIVAQVMTFARRLGAEGERLTNIVVMGMGEPFHNYDATLAALDRLERPHRIRFRRAPHDDLDRGAGAGHRPLRERAAPDQPGRLAPRRHRRSARPPASRQSALPAERPLRRLPAVCGRHAPPHHLRVGTDRWGERRARTGPGAGAPGRGLTCHVNLIPLNPTGAYPGSATPRQKAHAFAEELRRMGVPATVRMRRGIDIQAGCGQLATQAADRAPKS